VADRAGRVARDVTDSPDKLTTDPPLPPGTPDIDELVGDPTPGAGSGRSDDAAGPRTEPDDEDVTSDGVVGEDGTPDTVSVEPPD
jgi:hypothetical protein